MNQPMGWLKRKPAANYGGVGLRTLDEWLKTGLRSVKLPTGTRLIKLEWIDEFLMGFAADKNSGPDVDQIVNDICGDL